MPGKKKIIKKIADKVKPPKPKPKKNINKKKVNTSSSKKRSANASNKKGSNKSELKNTTTSNKSWDNPKITTGDAAKKIVATGGKNIGKVIKYGTILAGIKETLGDWTGLTNLITGKGKYAAPSKNMQDYDADPGIKRGDADPDSKNYNSPDQFQQGGPVFNFKGQQVPGMKTDSSLTRDEKGIYRRGGSK